MDFKLYIYICTKKLPRRHVQMSRRPLPQKRLKQREEKAYRLPFPTCSFRPTKTIEITPRPSFFHTLPWLLTHPQYINICEKPLSLWRNLETSLKRNISMCKNARPLRGAPTMFLSASVHPFFPANFIPTYGSCLNHWNPTYALLVMISPICHISSVGSTIHLLHSKTICGCFKHFFLMQNGPFGW